MGGETREMMTKTKTEINYSGEKYQRGADWRLSELRQCGVKTAIVKANGWADSETPVGPFGVYYSDTAGCDNDCTAEYVTKYVEPVYLTIFV
jgi:hypothetical protein